MGENRGLPEAKIEEANRAIEWLFRSTAQWAYESDVSCEKAWEDRYLRVGFRQPNGIEETWEAVLKLDREGNIIGFHANRLSSGD